MGILLFRVDERLIHGQVAVGWGGMLVPERFLVVDDALPTSPLEKDLYAMAAPEGSLATFLTVAEAREELPDWQSSEVPAFLLTRDLGHMLRLSEEGLLAGEAINLGGIHYRPGREQVLPYLFLDGTDRKRIRAIIEGGASVWAQDLPGNPKTPAEVLLDE